MADQEAEHFLKYFFAGMRSHSDAALIYERKGPVFQTFSKRDVTSQINAFARALHGLGIATGDRVAFQMAPSANFWISEWGTLANRAVAVIVPHPFSIQELRDIILESSTKILFIDRLEAAIAVCDIAQAMPCLTHIVCMEGAVQAALPILSWNDFVDSGRSLPDRSSALLRSIAAKDTALLFYYRDKDDRRQATRYSHTLLMESARKIDGMISARSPWRADDIFLAAQDWDNPVGHIASCYVPLLRQSAIQIAGSAADMAVYENRPSIVVGTSSSFERLRDIIHDQIKKSGRLEAEMLITALSFSKIKYESETKKKLSLLQKFLDVVMRYTIVKKVQSILGGKMHLLIGIDDEAHYDLVLFFHTFGIDLLEMPPDMLH